MIQIESIDQTSPYLPMVKALGRANTGALGFFPDGAFNDYALQRHIIIARDPHQDCVGYLLYRISHGWAIIVHLCVDQRYRRNGIARRLVDHLCTETQDLIGIRADCRRDYAISTIWPQLGFHAAGERPGRSQLGSKLTIWRLEHGHPDLFTVVTMERLKTKILVAIDANVFYDLMDSTRPDREEALALLADWLSDEIELTVSDELWNEINRGQDEWQRQRARIAAAQFHHFPTHRARFEEVQQSLRLMFPEQMSPNDESDLRQLARAIAGDVPFFVTRDQGLLHRADGIYQAHGIAIRRPSDLIIQLDELRRQQEYQPARLAGTMIAVRRVQSQEQSSLYQHFQHDDQEETRSDFERLLRPLLAATTTVECLLAHDTTHTPLLLIAYDRSEPGMLKVPLLRVRRGPLAPTLARYLLLMSVVRSAREGRQLTVITDPVLDPFIPALQQDAFAQLTDTGWAKIHLSLADTAQQVAQTLRSLGVTDSALATFVQQLAETLTAPETVTNGMTVAELERLIWPVKIVNGALPTFLVPIQPRWAQELFDEELANQTLFGATKLLALNREAIYYRSSRPRVLEVPGRILWYVSQDRHGRYQGGGAIRACSRLEEVLLGQPKDLFRQFQRLGIYEWRHMVDAVQGDITQSMMAVRFSHTEIFRHPIPLAELRNMYSTAGYGLVVQSPTRLPTPDLFAQIYRQGMGLLENHD